MILGALHCCFEHALTDLGVSLQHVMVDMKVWAEAHMDQVLANREGYDTRFA